MPALRFSIITKCNYCGHDYLSFGIELWLTGEKCWHWLPRTKCPIDGHYLIRKPQSEIDKLFEPIKLE